MSPQDIAEQIEQAWAADKSRNHPVDFDAYVGWLSERWSTLSHDERQLLINCGAAVFDLKLRGW